ncbi:hypothetical protein AJ80_08561 [Polytolypa hystricis UAMH7299]|uniref:C2H2-type domain-containing protein n=1 Tax=Polytolypa hystricis (strain UAMH7299) TaxID=1447883 RepID=A0A2B7X578_POLH7|nr:hypothetical protein AJ80_08561 [Polytolypa hystricis UAMH7299]
MARDFISGCQASADTLGSGPGECTSRVPDTYLPPSSLAHIRTEHLPPFSSSQGHEPSHSLPSQLGSKVKPPTSMAYNARRARSLSESAPITYTPTTHRVSKAKKGKRVHGCDHPGCHKVFTRAEHLRRHQLNHNPVHSFRCKVEACGKGFQRHDLLTRHMEKHNLATQTTFTTRPSPSPNVQSSMAPVVTSQLSPAPLPQRSASVPAHTQQPSSMSIDSIVQHGTPHNFGHDFMPIWADPERRLSGGEMFHDLMRVHADEALLLSSPDTSRSPSLEESPYQFPQQIPSMESYSEPYSYRQVHSSPPLPLTTIPEWNPTEPVSQATQMLPIAYEGDILQTVGEPSLSVTTGWTMKLTLYPAFPVPTPLSTLDGHEWFTLRRELASAPGVVSGKDGMEVIDTIKWQDCFECYWKHFHPHFPIVHRPTFFATKPSPLLSGAMLAIGSQYDTRPHSKQYSLALLEACQKLLSKRSAITSRSRVSDLQAVFLLEILSKYRSKKADVKFSQLFRTLYGSFFQDCHLVKKSPFTVFNSLAGSQNPDGLRKAHKFWVDHEARRRVLQASFTLDVQQFMMFQEPTVILQSSPDPAKPGLGGPSMADLPFPCNSELWECKDLNEWNEHAKTFEPLTIASMAERIVKQNESSRLDSFQCSLILDYMMLTNIRSADLGQIEQTIEPFIHRLRTGTIVERFAGYPGKGDEIFSTNSTDFMYHALLAVHRTPLRALLTVCGQSGFFERRVTRAQELESAKQKLRAWAMDTDEVKKAVWHAIRVLEYAVGTPQPSAERPRCEIPSQLSPDLPIGYSPVKGSNEQYYQLNSFHSNGGQDENRLAYECAQELSSPLIQFPELPLPPPPPPRACLPVPPPPPVSAPPAHTGPLLMLQANWALYISALICWAYGINNPPTPADDSPSLVPAVSAQSYISTMTALAPCWSLITPSATPTYIRRSTSALLEHIRATSLQPGSMGGLLDEGQKVLQRLTKPRSTLNPPTKRKWKP